jgi:hypothetical protein
MIPWTGYKVKAIIIDGMAEPFDSIDADGVGYYTLHVGEVGHTIKAMFEKITYKIDADAVPADPANPVIGGTITPFGEKTVEYGASQAYTITYQTGYKISEVLIDGINDPVAVNSGKYTFSNVMDDHTIVAVFEARTYPITVSVGANGEVVDELDVPILDGTVLMVNHGTSQYLKFNPATGYVIDKVLIDGKNDNAAVYYGYHEFTNVTASHTVVVSFKLAPPPPAPPAPPIGGDEGKTIAYPNPTTGILKIKNEELEINLIQLFDTNGKLMQEIKNIDSTEISIDLSTYPEGLYFLNIDDQTIKVMKQQ